MPAPPDPARITAHQRDIHNCIVQLIETGNDAAAASEAVRLIRNNRHIPLAGKNLFRRLAAYARRLSSEQKLRIVTAILAHQAALANEIDEHPHQSGQVAIHHFSQYPSYSTGIRWSFCACWWPREGQASSACGTTTTACRCTTTRWLCENGAAADINSPNGGLTPLRLDANKNDPAWGSLLTAV
ncbi:unnamed protein product [Vitrella brassicaformis CCMP3155]|uniref:Uncharacterized protein n=1 Tax=Vitrella brassicaformis (strain CCMP3155) TaxID=1169540 RepID=A0A0G4F5D0_VITBC|nr:unnamed protein product [Vitrella brassicaformis CCMP3155]|eukprot:CEM07050.1 unnamed protein product [Vitrella brassicaformis CCMP3155]